MAIEFHHVKKSLHFFVDQRPFGSGFFFGAITTFLIVWGYFHVKVQRLELEAMQTTLYHMRSQGGTAPELERRLKLCQDDLVERGTSMTGLKAELEQTFRELEHTRKDLDALAHGDVVNALERCREREEAKCDDRVADTKKQLDAMEIEKMDAQQQKLTCENERDLVIERAIHKAQTEAVQKAEDRRRELDNQLHSENLKHLAESKMALRHRDLALRDKELLQASLADAQEEAKKCYKEAAEKATEQHMALVSAQDEAKNLVAALTRTEKDLAEKGMLICTLCSYSRGVHFDACHRCQHRGLKGF
eukprot:jgi/Mesvir1/17564/Mv08807-RA.1